VELKSYLAQRQRAVDLALDRFIPPLNRKPSTLHRAMRYSLFAGGKRLRPILCLAAAEACGGRVADAMPLACAVECVHTYSLIHDDLPCMDDDDFRRGKPTCHKVFGEAVAVLAGDALLTSAFEICARARAADRYPIRQYVSELAEASGSLKLVAGQVADLEAEKKRVTPAELRFIHTRKTAALLSASLRLGAMSANATPRQLNALGIFGENLGLAFQVIDDILDRTQSSEKLGKSAGKDEKSGKATYPAIHGMAKSRREAARLTAAAHAALSPLKSQADILRALADYLLDREY
jgi:geranylgeranyl diphosphate synthase type II